MSDIWNPSPLPLEECTPADLKALNKLQVVRVLLSLHHHRKTNQQVINIIAARHKGSELSKKTASLVKFLFEDCDGLDEEWYNRAAVTADEILNRDTFHRQVAEIDLDYARRLVKDITINARIDGSEEQKGSTTTVNVVTNVDEATTPLYFVYVAAYSLKFVEKGTGRQRRTLLLGPSQCMYRAIMKAALEPTPTAFCAIFRQYQRGPAPEEIMAFRDHILENPLADRLRDRLNAVSMENQEVAKFPTRHDVLEVTVDSAWRWIYKLIVLVAITSSGNDVGNPHPINITMMIHCLELHDYMESAATMKKGKINTLRPSKDLLNDMAPLARGTDNTNFFGNYWSETASTSKRPRMESTSASLTLNISHEPGAPTVSRSFCHFCGGDHISGCSFPSIFNFIYLLPDQSFKGWTKGSWGKWTMDDVRNMRFGWKKPE